MAVNISNLRTYFLRGLVITAVSLVVHITVYAVIFILPTYLPEYWWLSWVIFLLWLPLSILFLGWLATEVVLHWLPAVKIEVKPALLAREAGHQKYQYPRKTILKYDFPDMLRNLKKFTEKREKQLEK